MPKKEKMFKMKLKLEEIIHEDDMIVFPIFSNSQTIIGIDEIKPTLDVLNDQLQNFINSVLIKNNKKSEK